MQSYTLGFIFDSSLQSVLLIHKDKPTWQKGRINGIGGKIEKNESAVACMIREIKEETDLVIKENELKHVGNLSSEDFFTEVFTCIYSGNIDDATSLEAQRVEWFPINKLPKNIIDNLSWLIPLSVDKLKNKEPKSVIVKY